MIVLLAVFALLVDMIYGAFVFAVVIEQVKLSPTANHKAGVQSELVACRSPDHLLRSNFQVSDREDAEMADHLDTSHRCILLFRSSLYISVLDSPKTSSTRFIKEARSTGGRVLVHCLCGVSRSVTIVGIMSASPINPKAKYLRQKPEQCQNLMFNEYSLITIFPPNICKIIWLSVKS